MKPSLNSDIASRPSPSLESPYRVESHPTISLVIWRSWYSSRIQNRFWVSSWLVRPFSAQPSRPCSSISEERLLKGLPAILSDLLPKLRQDRSCGRLMTLISWMIWKAAGTRPRSPASTASLGTSPGPDSLPSLLKESGRSDLHPLVKGETAHLCMPTVAESLNPKQVTALNL